MIRQRLARRLFLFCICTSIRLSGATRSRSQAYDHSTAPYYSEIEQQPGGFVHPVTEALQALPHCNLSGDDAALSSGRWYKDADGEYFYEPETCRIRRLSAEAARSCLSGKHIAFIGDSVTRYEYLSLVYFLSKKQYMERYGASIAGEPSLVNEKDWSSWGDFFANGSARISAAVEAEAVELCDCHRTPTSEVSFIREHRDFVLLQLGEAPIRVSYHFSYNFPSVEESMMHELIQLFACGEQHPDVVVLNMGHWLHGFGGVQQSQLQLKQDASWLHRLHGTVLRSASHLVAAMDNLKAVLFWQPTTPMRGYDAPTMEHSQTIDNLETVVRQTISQAAPWQVLDVRSIAKASLMQNLNFYWDSLHFLPVMYEQFNDLLLHDLCNDG